MSTLVSIIIPTYNRAHLIEDTLNSIGSQSYVNWECIVVDDGSTDHTEQLLNTYIEKDRRFKFYKRPETKPKGANACRNFGFEMSKGDYINWFDSDDIMEPNKLEVQVDLLQHDAEIPYCICQTKWIDKTSGEFLGLRAKQISSNRRFEDYTLYNIFWSILAPLWRRSFIEENQLSFDETLHQSQEFDFHIKALAINSNYKAIDDALVSMFRHENNMSNNIYASDSKIESNLKVKDKIINNYMHKLSSKGRLKFLEMQTLMFKDLLKEQKFKFAKQIMSKLFKTIKYVDVSVMKKMVFCSQMLLAYASYRISGRGYNLIKPLT
ncbi:glycosyltransferase family 2 protein [uncultured Psychroserpens sp.]|uniref:glycosyltransferase family 2 protein n=1 Tax=uncultured Psychroserpens sp. TaxID=255436 RepID=UPI002623DA11|nr:glycosyltransferase family 2 protein [uncultured Psychroserpens sp.]